MKENQAPAWYEIGSAQYPLKRDEIFLPTPFDWLNVKQDVDSIEIDDKHPRLWRIHDDLYDFTNFHSHPGGYSFIDFTKNTDITEMFESSHVDIDKARGMLSKYFIKKATTPRNSRCLTFHSDGFYCTLRKRVFEFLKNKQKESSSKKWPYSKPYLQSTSVVHDVLLFLFIGLMFLGASVTFDVGVACQCKAQILLVEYLLTAGFVLSLLMMCAHNFFHLRDNWRMYSFDISMFSSHEWRISHGYSHHGFPNTILDYEIAAFEPFVRFLPYSDKGSLVSMIGTFLFITMMMPLAMHTMFLKRILVGLVLPIFNPSKVTTEGLRWENFIPCLVFGATALVYLHSLLRNSYVPVSFDTVYSLMPHVLYVSLVRCSIMYIACSACFLYLSLAGTHHHANVWHAGDPAHVHFEETIVKMDKKNLDHATIVAKGIDWGALQLLATGRRPSLDRHLWTAAVIFGQHGMHHLFPTLDLSILYDIEPIFRQTCGEFGLNRLIDTSKSGKDDRRSLSDLQCFSGTLYQAFFGNVGHEENFYPEVWNYYQDQLKSSKKRN